MRLSRFPKHEPSRQCWIWRLLFGPASIADGIVETLTFGFYGLGMRLTVTRNLALARLNAADRRAQAAHRKKMDELDELQTRLQTVLDRDGQPNQRADVRPN